jgi:lysophospholipase L1-like esterase
MVILIFGDSITQGYWDEEGGWADRIKRYVMDTDIKRGHKGYHGVFNLGIDANFTQDVVKRFDSEVNARRFAGADANSDYGIIFAIGVNDTLHKGSGYQSSPAQYLKELESLSQKAKELTSRIAFINLLPVDESVEDQATASEDLFYTNDRIELFNDVLKKFCKENRLTLVDARSLFLNNYGLFSPDGTHPNTEGHKAIYSQLLPILNTWLYKK